MPGQLDCALHGLQQLAYARITREFHRAWQARAACPASCEAAIGGSHRRVQRCEQVLAQLRLLIDDPQQIAKIKIARALYLRLLLESAPMRLQSWSDSESFDDMPRSHLFEWIAYDFEQLELAELEGSMTPEEAASYAQALDARASSLREE
ncbi:hypothetical protein VAPA_1c06430 [Variovorax paradoxus B4]|uniref:Uncharacterized protein n=1 Tax=Variovorax paradoxus B4 TaxID=1246301 RepID=T1X598_VARPD|nr:hypothetical protein [Variovorax paradoxus]AGU47773.1 hypothetical protein VAPA_1c06430 [Variovorax paradoxus B4]